MDGCGKVRVLKVTRWAASLQGGPAWATGMTYNALWMHRMKSSARYAQNYAKGAREGTGCGLYSSDQRPWVQQHVGQVRDLFTTGSNSLPQTPSSRISHETVHSACKPRRGRSVSQIFGSPDDLKFRSSMTLFASATAENQIFIDALQKYFNGAPDQATLDLV